MGTVLFLVLAVLGAPYEAVALERIDAPAPAEKLYAFTLRILERVHGSLAPDWAYMNLAALRRQPERQVQIAQLARDNHPEISATLYERAINAGPSDQRLDWLEQYADVLAPRDVYEAAKVRFAAAGIAAGGNDRDRTIRNFEGSLALVDDPNVRWQEARFLLHADDARAANVLSEIVKRNQGDTAASYALGLKQWQYGDMDEAQASLQRAAADEQYRPTLQAFMSGREAATRLQSLQDDEASQKSAVQAEHSEATARHKALYERLHRFDCDARQLSDWENRTDQQIGEACNDIKRTYVLNSIITLGISMLLPELLIGRLGAAAEAGAVEGRVLSAEAIAAARAGATADKVYEISIIGPLRSGEAQSVERSVGARKQYAWKTVGTQFTAKLEAEQNWVMQEIELVFEVREQEIVRRFEPLEADAKSTKDAAETQRTREITTVSESRPVFRVKLGKVHVDGSSSDCKTDQPNSGTESCPAGKP